MHKRHKLTILDIQFQEAVADIRGVELTVTLSFSIFLKK